MGPMNDRMARTVDLYRNVFSASTDTMPLIVTPPLAPLPSETDFVREPADSVRRAMSVLRPKAQIGSDWLPFINIPYYQCIVVPSFFGAEPTAVKGSCAIVKPFFATIEEAADAGIPAVAGAVFDEMMTTLRAAKNALEEDFSLSFPSCSSPFDLAQLMVPGDEFLASLLEKPEPAMRFLSNLTALCIEVFQSVRNELHGSLSEVITLRGCWFPGLRLPCDAIVTYSPTLMRRFVLPILDRFAARFGRLCIHFCTTPSPSAHVLPVLCESPHVEAVDNWQGPATFLGDSSPAKLQDSVAVFTDEDLSTEKKMESFLRLESVRSVARIGGRGLVVSTRAPSVEEGRRIYQQWRSRT